MSTKQAVNKKPKQRRPPLINLLLALSLIPLAGGIIVAVLTAVGVVFMASDESQAMVGAFFMLVSFAMINGLQKKWVLASGWGLPALGLLLLTLSTTEWQHLAAYGMMGIGVILIVFEIARTMRAQLPAGKN